MVGDLYHVEVVFDYDSRVAAVDEPVDDVEQLPYILEVESRSRLVEDIERTAGIAFGKLGCQLDALRLAAREHGAGLAERQVAQSDLLYGMELLPDRGYVLKELDGHVDGHVQYIVDVLALVAHFERLAIIASAAAGTARHIDVGQEIHLDSLLTRTAALLAAAALDIERETAGLEASYLSIGRRLEEFAYVRKDARVCRRIAARRASYGRLVDHDEFVDMLDTLHAVALQRLIERAV